jgi:hypothetical protein
MLTAKAKVKQAVEVRESRGKKAGERETGHPEDMGTPHATGNLH